MDTRPDGRPPAVTKVVRHSTRTRQRWARAAVLAVELALIVLTFWFNEVEMSIGDDAPPPVDPNGVTADESAVLALALWNLLAFGYVVVGAVVVRRAETTTSLVATGRVRRTIDVLFSVAAGLTGLGTGTVIAARDLDPDVESALRALGVTTVLLSWMLMHAGFARRYRRLTAVHGGLRFPVPDGYADVGPDAPPRPVADFYYYAFTLGTAFGATDVQVTTSRMRWNSMMHSIIAFFFNAAVVAFAINVLAGSE
ncbi:DUF1345 domain-containing protein [Nakamurella leprariae]|uniref:DUF1345 domain-containing protein n=1 Tax=Nakamurella leprariae TaxID=2803911 RepID=A0A939BZN9_9ACTN|nr:DUF1345 domain-containing protein [Nakamurella leprariae]MBM9467891.1 DUF1345 domain-containing protein [Nakamurella leprariae]